MIQNRPIVNCLSIPHQLNQCAGPTTLLVISHLITSFRIFHLAGTLSPGRAHYLQIRRLIFINSIPDHRHHQKRNHPHCHLQWRLPRSPSPLFRRRHHRHHLCYSKVFTRILVSQPTGGRLSQNVVKSIPLIPTWSYQTQNNNTNMANFLISTDYRFCNAGGPSLSPKDFVHPVISLFCVFVGIYPCCTP